MLCAFQEVISRAGTERLANRGLLLLSDLQYVVQEFKKIREVPNDPMEQLNLAIKALLNSWFSDSSLKMREAMNLPETLGTAFIIQSMVFGNFNQHSGTGVCFTR